MLTAYDYPTACLLDAAEIDIILVGDSLGMVVLGYENTLPVSMQEMLHHVRAVRRGCKRALLVADMPFMSYHSGVEDTIRNAGSFIKEGGCAAVKLEGGGERIVKLVRALSEVGIAVMGHLGLTPQSVHRMGGFRVQAKTSPAADLLIEQALQLEKAGIFALVLEGIPAHVAARLTPQLDIPTLGIGAGNACDGQVLVTHDMLGLLDTPAPKFAKRYANLWEESLQAVRRFKQEVQTGDFPSRQYWYS